MDGLPKAKSISQLFREDSITHEEETHILGFDPNGKIHSEAYVRRFSASREVTTFDE